MSNGPEEVDIADWTGKLALELVGQAGLGYPFGALEGRDDEFCRAVKEWVSVKWFLKATLADFLSSPAMSSLVVARNLFPYVDRVFRPQILKFLGRALPWPKLNHLIDIADTLKSNSKDIHEAKKRLLESGDDATSGQVEDGKNIISILSSCNTPNFQIWNLM